MREGPYSIEIETETQVILVSKRGTPPLFDPKGRFKIMIDRNDETIAALHFFTSKRDKPTLIVKGETAEEVYKLWK